jgi:amino acid transporter
MAVSTPTKPATGNTLQRKVGVFSLTMISLGSIIGSGWLLGAYKGATHAGPASVLSWVLAAAMLALLALIHAELGTAYPIAGGTARFPAFAFGTLTGFIAGWSAWLQAVGLAPIEVEASLTYLNNIGWVSRHLNLLNADSTLTASGIGWASLLMVVFTIINAVGVKALSDSNSITMIWKTAVPIVTVVVLLSLSFHPGNFTAGGGFLPYGAHGIFAALPAGVVFALQGFEQCIQMGGEARDPQKDIARAVIIAMLIGVVIYIGLEMAFIGSLDPNSLLHGWAAPIDKGKFGPYATLAVAAGAGWLSYILYADAFISPTGTGLVYMGTTSRLSYAMGQAGELPKALGRINKRGIPFWSVLLAFVVGEVMFLPFPSWQALVGLVTSATAIMYSFAPLALTALRRSDPERPRPYRLPAARLLAPVGYVSANLIIYWGGFDTTWRVVAGLAVGVVLFVLTRMFSSDRSEISRADWKGVGWIPVWLAGTLVIGYLGRYDSGTYASGGGEINLLPNWWDLVVVIVFSLAIYYWAVRLAAPSEQVAEFVAEDEAKLAQVPQLNVA